MALCCAGATLVSSARLLRGVVGASQLGRPALFYCTAITSGRMEVNGANLHYQRTGCGDHVLLLLPGALGSSQTDFGPQLKFLNKDIFTIIGWDPRGYGLSIPPARDYPADFFSRDAKDAVDLMQAMNFKRFSLLGWSDGGITALIAAGSYPSLINKLVVWGANAYVTEEDLDLYNAVAAEKKRGVGIFFKRNLPFTHQTTVAEGSCKRCNKLESKDEKALGGSIWKGVFCQYVLSMGGSHDSFFQKI
ncbi:serine hydrolase BPHL isoform X4 [Rhinoderma darwinii]|uniref:serine hydrolase BPHL isoform X4 n=1 Tax=Rhinoderma darwinii TaxID=43563 RepID=UPI003F6721AF